MARKVGKAKAASKTGKKSASGKKASAKKPAPAKKAKTAAKTTAPLPKPAAPPPTHFSTTAFVPIAAAPPPKPAVPTVAPSHDPEILSAVGECVDEFMDNAPHPGWSNDDKVTKFKYSPISILGLLTTVRACLLPKYQFTIPKGFPEKCTSDTETILLMKIDISKATKKTETTKNA